MLDFESGFKLVEEALKMQQDQSTKVMEEVAGLKNELLFNDNTVKEKLATMER